MEARFVTCVVFVVSTTILVHRYGRDSSVEEAAAGKTVCALVQELPLHGTVDTVLRNDITAREFTCVFSLCASALWSSLSSVAFLVPP